MIRFAPLPKIFTRSMTSGNLVDSSAPRSGPEAIPWQTMGRITYKYREIYRINPTIDLRLARCGGQAGNAVFTAADNDVAEQVIVTLRMKRKPSPLSGNLIVSKPAGQHIVEAVSAEQDRPFQCSVRHNSSVHFYSGIVVQVDTRSGFYGQCGVG